MLETVCDPEVPVLPILDLGIVRDVKMKLLENGYKNIKVTPVLSPAWTTDCMSEAGKKN
jgi:ring-1,2-phenylacetyl-CoA epoxidase subunit PaaD